MQFIARKIDGELYVSLDQVNKAIEEKDAEIENFKADIRRLKNKRCFKMARWCISMIVFNSKYGTDKRWHHFKKWRDRWLELAEKFKEAK